MDRSHGWQVFGEHGYNLTAIVIGGGILVLPSGVVVVKSHDVLLDEKLRTTDARGDCKIAF